MIDQSSTASSGPRRLRVGLLLLLPVLVQALAVQRFGTNMPLWDEFVYVDALRAIGDGRPWWPWIWRQHNEHRVVWAKLLLFAHAGLSHWDPRVDMYVSSLAIGVIAWGIWRLYRAAGGTRLTPFVPVAFLLCSLAQYMNILYGFMNEHYFTIAGMVWAIVFLLRGTRRGLVAAMLCAFAATISTLGALAIWPIGLIVLLMTSQPWSRRIAWIAAIAACATAYFWRYDNPPGTGWADALAPAADAFLMNLGSTLSAANAAASRVLGLMTLAAIAVYCSRLRDPLTRRRHAGLVALTLIALATAVAVGARRSSLGAITALDSKYVTYSMFGLIGPYLGLRCLPGMVVRRMAAGLTAVLTVGLVAANVYGWQAARAWKQQRLQAKYLIQTFEIQTDESLASIFFPSQLREIAAYLRATGLGPFGDRVDVLMAPRWRDGLPSAAITRGAPIEAHLICPVDTLVDLAVAVEPGGPAGSGGLYLTIVAGGAVVARGSLESSRLTTTRFVRATLATPLRDCRGQDLLVEVTTDIVNPFAAPRAWTYPVYYAGVVRQAGQLFERRNLGIAFNAVSYGVLP